MIGLNQITNYDTLLRLLEIKLLVSELFIVHMFFFIAVSIEFLQLRVWFIFSNRSNPLLLPVTTTGSGKNRIITILFRRSSNRKIHKRVFPFIYFRQETSMPSLEGFPMSKSVIYFNNFNNKRHHSTEEVLRNLYVY